MTDMTQSYGYSLPRENQKLIAGWLVLMALLVFSMVVLGGVTRLTNSGLSMVEWKPVTGWLPPIGEQAWAEEFAKYKAFPEYQKVNAGMSLSEFKGIFAFEYSHRLLGRVIGLAFVVPFLVLLALRKIPRPLIPRLIGLLLLGGSQGVMGWVMVKSGLVDQPDVSHYRLTAHLFLACLIFIALLWTALDLYYPGVKVKRQGKASRLAVIFFGLVFFQILIGGFVAGLDAGFIYNEWPLMGGQFVPEDIFQMAPWYKNFLRNVATIQFSHRMVAYTVFAAALYLFYVARKSDDTPTRASVGISVLTVAVILQVLLGIWTLLSIVPVSLGALHQAGGLTVLGLSIFVWHAFSRDTAVGRPRR